MNLTMKGLIKYNDFYSANTNSSAYYSSYSKYVLCGN